MYRLTPEILASVKVNVLVFLKGVSGKTWQLSSECSIVENLFRNHLRPIRRLLGV